MITKKSLNYRKAWKRADGGFPRCERCGYRGAYPILGFYCSRLAQKIKPSHICDDYKTAKERAK